MAQTRTEPGASRTSGAFVDAAQQALRELRRSTAELLSGLAGVDRPVRLAERLGIDRSLAWKVWRVAQGEEAYPSPAHIPGRGGFARFVRAAEVAGAGSGQADAARAAFDALEAVLRQHAGDRASGAIMLGGLSQEGRLRQELALRRGGYRAACHFLGVHAQALYQADLLMPGPAGFRASVARLRGHFDLRRTRGDVAWVLGRTTLVTPKGPSADLKRTPLDDPGAGGLPGPPLVPAFCSVPLPGVRRVVLGGVTVEDELEPGAVGRSGSVDVVTGELFSQMRSDPAERVHAVTMAVSTPCQRLVYDVLAVEGVAAGEMTARVHSTVHGDTPYVRHAGSHTIPAPERFVDLGPLSGAPAPVEVPRHAEMTAWLARRMNVNPGAVRVWRLSMRFPPVPSAVAASYTPAG